MRNEDYLPCSHSIHPRGWSLQLHRPEHGVGNVARARIVAGAQYFSLYLVDTDGTDGAVSMDEVDTDWELDVNFAYITV